MPKARILVAEDERNLRQVLALQLQNAGYEVVEAVDGQAALELAQSATPDLILLDVMMPRLDGYEVCKRLRASFTTRHIPIIMLTARGEEEARITGLEGGANDYIIKPWGKRELELRIKNALEWSRQQRSASPLTGLPGNHSINEELKRRLAAGAPFAMLQIDVDFFKSFNDHYGYTRGDHAIQTLARIILTSAQKHGGGDAFVGHIGGDDFVALTTPERAEVLAEEIIARFNEAVTELYDAEDRERGSIEVPNRLHVNERFPLMSLTIALVSTDRMPVSHLAELIDVAQELKSHGKGIPGSVLVGERRGRGEGDSKDSKVA
ncbi:MAG: response regulator [Candidatus Eisenbacteria bacterium]|uniref:Response regulator n=1 Tax=Eiseniibacteriota bacterium TaxID=2212470 RepID=A0A9D6QLT5_UNCEI|nr:response regulator [Candidatus Eisenbacteria bacterium]MBI3539003.1 response regulator [Candidatus Eisenbacteria bacterium]